MTIMIRDLTEDELELLYKHAEGKRKEQIGKALRDSVRWRLIRELPAPVGRCASGRMIYADTKGAYSSGYVLHSVGCSVCDHEPWTWDPLSPEDQAKKALIEVLR